MEHVDLVKTDVDSVNLKSETAPVTALHHAAGTIEDTGPLVLTSAPPRATYAQTVPKNPLGEFLSRHVKLAAYTISNTDTLGVQATFDPWALFLAIPSVAAKTGSFSLIRGTFELVGVIAVPGNTYGTYVVSAVPDGGAAPVDGQAIEVGAAMPVECCMQVDHYTRFNCSESENVALQLPFLWPYDFAALPTGPAHSWTVNLSCLSPLRTAIPGGVSIGSITFYGRIMEDIELCVPQLQGKHAHAGQIQANPKLASMAPSANARGKGAVSSAMGTIGNVANALSDVPVIGSYAKAASKIAETVGGLASWFGFTREAAPAMPTHVAQRSFSTVANFDGNDASDVAALSISNAISIDPTIGGVVGEKDCLATTDLFARWTRVGGFTWTSADARDTSLLELPVSPFYTPTSGVSNMVLTTAGWFGLPFQYWRGDMEYLLVMPVSKLHRGSIQVFWVPSTTTFTGADPTNISLNEISGVGSEDETVYRIGFARDIPFAESRLLQPGGIVNTLYTNGTLVFRVVNPLASQNSAADVTAHVFARAGANMEFAAPVNVAWVPDTLSPRYDVLEAFYYQGKESYPVAEQVVELVNSSGVFPVDTFFFGERVESVRPLLQKFSRVRQNYISSPAVYWMSQLGPLPCNNVSQHGDSYFTFAGWYRAAFTGWATSERIKQLATDDQVYLAAFPFSPKTGLPPNTVAAALSTLTPISYMGSQRGNETTIPYYTPRKFMLGRVNYKNSLTQFTRGTGVVAVDQHNQPGAEPPALYHAFGPDCRVTCFRFIPKVSVRSPTSFPLLFDYVPP